MKKQQIKKLAKHINAEIIETHISWVLLTSDYAFKIKKPVKLEFLDFSTLALRKHFCERELELNRRLASAVYLEVVPLYEVDRKVLLEPAGEVVDYAVKMQKLAADKRMDKMLENGEVTAHHLHQIADELIPFHKEAHVMEQFDIRGLQQKFNALGEEVAFMAKEVDESLAEKAIEAMLKADNYLVNKRPLFDNRLHSGFIRDCHGDLHMRNVFLTDPPVIFDCIEFNDEYRQLDLLSEVAFMAMDLDAHDRPDLAEEFFNYYNNKHTISRSPEEKQLFYYFKAYYANVRTKVNVLNLKNIEDEDEALDCKTDAIKYMKLMCDSISLLD